LGTTSWSSRPGSRASPRRSTRPPGWTARAGSAWCRRVTLPLLTPTLFFLLVVSTILAIQSFGQIHILTRGGPAGATTTLVYSVYLNAFAFGSTNYGLASAEALVLFVIVLVVTAVQFGILERRVFYR